MLSLSACGKKSEPSMNYEQPVRTLALTMENYDERGYLDCFTSPAAEDFMTDKEYNEEFIKLLYPESSNGQKLSVTILEHEELDEKAIAQLKEDYTKAFKKRINISKAVKLSVRFKLYQKDVKRTDVKDITVVRVENVWYIYGGVINDFDFTTEKTSVEKAMNDAIDKAIEAANN